MAGSKRSTPDVERFVQRYGRRQSEVELLIEEEVFGAHVGANGYTTPAQVSELIEHIAREPGAQFLELGSGRGWPGVYLAEECGCTVVFTDVPSTGLQQSLASATRRGVGTSCSAAAADATLLPFRPEAFDAVVHADVLC